MDSKKVKEISDIIQYFNRQVSNIFKIIDNKDDMIKNNPDIDWVRRITKIVRNENPPYMLEKSIDKLWENKDSILNRDLNFLIDNDVAHKYIKNDCRKEWIEGMLTFFMDNLNNLNEDDRDYLWKCINNMLQAVIRYKIIHNDFL
jgi:hypothetical protein